jgi:hypothetical protein
MRSAMLLLMLCTIGLITPDRASSQCFACEQSSAIIQSCIEGTWGSECYVEPGGCEPGGGGGTCLYCSTIGSCFTGSMAAMESMTPMQVLGPVVLTGC